MEKIRLILAGGGTGGHFYPAVAIANRIKELLKDKVEVEIAFVGTKRGIEYRMRDNLGYPLHLINIRGLTRALTLKNLAVPFLALSALWKARKLIKSFQPHVVIGTGGYVCWPILRAAASCSVPIVLQEQNSFPGLTTRKLARFANLIFLGFGGAEKYLETSGKIQVSGNPVRTEIGMGDRQLAIEEYKLDPSKKTILILGGSQGARAINNAVLKSLNNGSLSEGIQLLWQTGKRDYTDVDASASKKADCTLFPFAQKMEQVYAAADLVIARAGALTIAELLQCRLPSVLIPYPFAAGDHQRKNAEDMVSAGMATVIDELELDNLDILQTAISFLNSAQYGTTVNIIEKQMADKKPAVDQIAEGVINLALQVVKQSNAN